MLSWKSVPPSKTPNKPAWGSLIIIYNKNGAQFWDAEVIELSFTFGLVLQINFTQFILQPEE